MPIKQGLIADHTLLWGVIGRILPSFFLALILRVVPIVNVSERSEFVVQSEFDLGLQHRDEEGAIRGILPQFFEEIDCGLVGIFIRPIGNQKLDRSFAFLVGIALVGGGFGGLREMFGAAAEIAEFAQHQPGPVSHLPCKLGADRFPLDSRKEIVGEFRYPTGRLPDGTRRVGCFGKKSAEGADSKASSLV